MKTVDYSVEMQDSTGRKTTLYISGDSINEAVASGVPLSQAKEDCETSAFWKAVSRGEIAEDAWVI